MPVQPQAAHHSQNSRILTVTIHRDLSTCLVCSALSWLSRPSCTLATAALTAPWKVRARRSPSSRSCRAAAAALFLAALSAPAAASAACAWALALSPGLAGPSRWDRSHQGAHDLVTCHGPLPWVPMKLCQRCSGRSASQAVRAEGVLSPCPRLHIWQAVDSDRCTRTAAWTPSPCSSWKARSGSHL